MKSYQIFENSIDVLLRHHNLVRFVIHSKRLGTGEMVWGIAKVVLNDDTEVVFWVNLFD